MVTTFYRLCNVCRWRYFTIGPFMAFNTALEEALYYVVAVVVQPKSNLIFRLKITVIRISKTMRYIFSTESITKLVA